MCESLSKTWVYGGDLSQGAKGARSYQPRSSWLWVCRACRMSAGGWSYCQGLGMQTPARAVWQMGGWRDGAHWV